MFTLRISFLNRIFSSPTLKFLATPWARSRCEFSRKDDTLIVTKKVIQVHDEGEKGARNSYRYSKSVHHTELPLETRVIGAWFCRRDGVLEGGPKQHDLNEYWQQKRLKKP